MGSAQSLYERVGGVDAVKAAIALLYDKILADPLLIPFFEHVDVDRLRASQSAFVCMAFGGPAPYSGPALRRVHEKLVAKGLNNKHFDQVALHLRNSMEELGMPPSYIHEALAIVESTRADILNQ